MASFNSVHLMGNLSRDPELRFLPNGKAVANFSIAMNHKWKTESGEQKEDVCFCDITVWGKTAENCAQYLKKGRPVFVSGRLKQETWDDKQTGAKRSKLGVVAETVQFLGSAPGTEGGGAPARSQRPPPASAQADLPVEGDGPPESDDVPFNQPEAIPAKQHFNSSIL